MIAPPSLRHSNTYYKGMAFFLCYFAYTILRCTRTTFSYDPGEIEDWHNSFKKGSRWGDDTIGNMNFLFLCGYAIGLFINGNLADKLNPRFFFSFALLATGGNFFILYLFGAKEVLNEYYYYILWFSNGYV